MIADGASLVCSVESTRWPVSAACTAISAVSRSRISPTMMMSGSCRISARTPSAKPRSMPCCTCIWLNAGSTISIGSSTVQTLTSSVRQLLQRRVQRGGLARAGRAGDQDDAVRPLDQLLPALAVLVRRSRARRKLAHQHFRVEDAHHQLFAEGGRQRRQAQLDFSSAVAVATVLMRPSCGRRFSTTSMRPSILMRLVIARITAGGIW